MTEFGNLVLSGLTSGAIYAVLAVCLALWFRVANMLNLAAGDFAMIGALGVDLLARVHGWNLGLAIVTVLAVIALIGLVYDLIVLRIAVDWGRAREGIVAIFFFTFALSFVLEGVAQQVFGTVVHAAPALWPGNALDLHGLHVQRAGLLVIGFAVLVGAGLALCLRFTLVGKAMAACGENAIGARIVGIDSRRFRRGIFVLTAVLAGTFGILGSPITGFVYNSGAGLSLSGVVAAAFAGFTRPGRAVLAGLAIGLLEAFLSGYVSTAYGETLLYGVLAAVMLFRPQLMGLPEVAH
ncbi:MAG TPA: branched-chain amino acid ABC transporter permease [Candidatus Dormibacteraeota bacterium]|nr:branched-chain amino acid ABC transporter permease [Candidatus Dormibacteraeota bacterium]